MEIDWHRLFFSDQPYSFFIEILIRTLIMFTAAVITLRLAGKREVQQLSIFEMVMIITLGSAAGDPMFYEDVGVLHALAVFTIVLGAYRLMIGLITRSKRAETLLEGKPQYVIREGRLCIGEMPNDELGSDEFFGQLRGHSIEHLGQLRCVILEDTGKLSVFFYPDEEVRPGLPILPDEYFAKSQNIKKSGLYSCTHCGYTDHQDPSEKTTCKICKNVEWVEAINRKRISS